MKIKEEFKQFCENAGKEIKLIYDKVKMHPLTCLCCIIVIIIAVFLLIVLPSWRVAQFNITNPKELADAENSFRSTLAQILGGGAVLIGIYFAWKNLVTAREGQITDRFTRAVEQLGATANGNPSMEIRLGGIFALMRIANESDKDYWPITEILTAYVRKNSSINDLKITAPDKNALDDIQAILTVIGKRKSYNGYEETRLDLQRTYLKAVFLPEAHLEAAWLDEAYLKKANLHGAFLQGANLPKANLEGANLEEANFERADLQEAKLIGAQNLTVEQLSKVKTLYKAQLDPELKISLSEKYSYLFEEPKDEP